MREHRVQHEDPGPREGRQDGAGHDGADDARERFIAMPFSASACGRWWRGTMSGTMAANTGQRIARPMPLVKVSSQQQRRG